ncbi:hypothetical protein [Pelistega suis]|uniref:hypothetical protein n=1 Tax=Pelistega suis TaxID=1631957 RepID=UPI00211B91B1|nr:hypothetical protein [Pelistega suis]MCQ9329857.1 hypothetical protein [Pelistega suis]
MHMQLVRAIEPAAISVGTGAALNYALEENYTYSNLINDIVLGVAIGKKVDVFHPVLKDIPRKLLFKF